ncbi:HU family DNA-binding protein [Thalassovita sp.]|uniref:HU family DNA-binding protein n=1 Tax=Thalassovita sp. TaxID=1979401 RepID=UPI002B26EF4A|nr:HU family DNA-binding protein [Thalassovita sp.]
MAQKTTTTELIAAIAAATDTTKTEAQTFLDAFKAVTTTALHEGKEVQIASFGTLKPKNRAARMGRNPATGESIQIAASTGVSFTPAKALKDALNL